MEGSARFWMDCAWPFGCCFMFGFWIHLGFFILHVLFRFIKIFVTLILIIVLICNELGRFSAPHWINQFKVIKRMTAASKDNLHLTPAPVPFNQSTDYRYWLSLLSIFVLTSLAVRSVLIPANDLQLNLCYVRIFFHLLRCCSLDNQSIKIDNKVWYLYVLLELKSIRSNLFTVVAVTTDRSAIINPEYFP